MFRQQIANLFIERPARRKNLGEWRQTLLDSGADLQRVFAAQTDSDWNRRVLSHIVGIERWGQRRLQVALGATMLSDEYDGYRPARERTWVELQQDFVETRQETAVLLAKISTPETRINHNMYGDLTVRGWLHYLNIHANMEAKKLK